jgi:hypothetical protein
VCGAGPATGFSENIVFNRVLEQMRERIHQRQFVMTVHAADEMEDDNLTVLDVEAGVLTGRIVERQKDRDTGEWRYLVRGESLAESKIVVAAKLSVTGKLVIITVYRD